MLLAECPSRNVVLSGYQVLFLVVRDTSEDLVLECGGRENDAADSRCRRCSVVLCGLLRASGVANSDEACCIGKTFDR